MKISGDGVLEKAAAEYAEQGFSIIRNVVPSELLDEARAHVEWLTRKYPDLRPEHFHHPLIRNDAFWARLVSDSRLVDIAEFFLGPDVACFTAARSRSSAISLPSGPSACRMRRLWPPRPKVAST